LEEKLKEFVVQGAEVYAKGLSEANYVGSRKLVTSTASPLMETCKPHPSQLAKGVFLPRIVG
jgi:hypothetical protein